MFTSLRHLRVVLVNLIIITLVYAPALAFMPGKSSQLAENSVRSLSLLTPNSSLITLTLAPHAEKTLVLKFRDEASMEDRQEIVESYGEPELQSRRVGEIGL